MNCGARCVEGGGSYQKWSAWPKCLSSCSLLTSTRTKSNRGNKLPFVSKGHGVCEKRTGPCIRDLWKGLRGGGGHGGGQYTVIWCIKAVKVFEAVVAKRDGIMAYGYLNKNVGQQSRETKLRQNQSVSTFSIALP